MWKTWNFEYLILISIRVFLFGEYFVSLITNYKSNYSLIFFYDRGSERNSVWRHTVAPPPAMTPLTPEMQFDDLSGGVYNFKIFQVLTLNSDIIQKPRLLCCDWSVCDRCGFIRWWPSQTLVLIPEFIFIILFSMVLYKVSIVLYCVSIEFYFKVYIWRYICILVWSCWDSNQQPDRKFIWTPPPLWCHSQGQHSFCGNSVQVVFMFPTNCWYLYELSLCCFCQCLMRSIKFLISSLALVDQVSYLMSHRCLLFHSYDFYYSHVYEYINVFIYKYGFGYWSLWCQSISI